MLSSKRRRSPLNEAILKPMAEQVSNTITKLLIQDPLQKYLEGQLKADECWPFYAACRQGALEHEANSRKSGGR